MCVTGVMWCVHGFQLQVPDDLDETREVKVEAPGGSIQKFIVPITAKPGEIIEFNYNC